METYADRKRREEAEGRGAPTDLERWFSAVVCNPLPDEDGADDVGIPVREGAARSRPIHGGGPQQSLDLSFGLAGAVSKAVMQPFGVEADAKEEAPAGKVLLAPINYTQKGESPSLARVPRLTWSFWVLKCLVTTVGETVSDVFRVNLGLGNKVAALFYCLLLVSLSVEFLLWTGYVAPTFWLSVLLTSICGTIFAQGMVAAKSLSSWGACVVLLVLLLATLKAWSFVEGTGGLDLQLITTRRRLAFYWLSVLLSFAAGAAGQDAITDIIWHLLGFGHDPTIQNNILGIMFGIYSGGALVIFAVWALPRTGPWGKEFTRRTCTLPAFEAVCFWLAFAITRAFGKSLGDVLAGPLEGSPGPMVITPPTFNSTAPVTKSKKSKETSTTSAPTSTPTSLPTAQPTMTIQFGGGGSLGAGYTAAMFAGWIVLIIIFVTLTSYDKVEYFDEKKKGEYRAKVQDYRLRLQKQLEEDGGDSDSYSGSDSGSDGASDEDSVSTFNVADQRSPLRP